MEDIRNSYPEYKAKREPIWGRIFIRRFSFYLTYPFINAGVSADDVSILSCFVAFVGSAFMCFNNTYSIWIGVFLLNLWSLLDCVDGNIARCKKESSLAGEFFDAVGGYTISAASMVGFGVAAYNTTNIIDVKFRHLLILLGCVGGTLDILSRLIYQKYSNNMMRMEIYRIGLDAVKTENEEFYSDITSNSFLKRISLFVDYEFGIGGDELLFLIIFAAIRRLDLFVIVYGVYHIAGFALVFFMYIMKMRKYKMKNGENVQGDK